LLEEVGIHPTRLNGGLMKRIGTAVLAVLVLAAAVGAGTARAAAKPLTVKTFDPFWYLAAPRHEPPTSIGSTVAGCRLAPGVRCPGVDLTEKGKVFELPSVDLSAANLSRARLRLRLNGASLAAADLIGADLNGTEATALIAPFANFGGADVAGLHATLGRLVGADFGGDEMYESQFFAADLAGANLRGATLGTELAGAVLSGADLRGVHLQGAELEFADLSHAKVGKNTLRGARLCDTVLPSGKVANRQKRCQLPALYIGVGAPQPTIKPSDPRYSLLLHAAGTWREAHREKCGWVCPEGGQWLTHLRGPSYAYRNLEGTHRFKGKTMALVNLTGANLSGADLGGTMMPGAAASSVDFHGADLEGADLTYGEFAGSDFEAASLVRADARDADLTRADLTGANLSGARLGAASLVEADLRGANLEGTDLSGADLYGAAVDPGFPAGATLCETVLPDGTVAAPGPGCEHR
jgi:uncharacterized protein YjbI with pentapeptide repeats